MNELEQCPIDPAVKCKLRTEDFCCMDCESFGEHNNKLISDLNKAKKALKWYANPDHYDYNSHATEKDRVLHSDMSRDFSNELSCAAGGKRARACLKELSGNI